MRILGASEIRIGRKTITPGAEVVFALGVYLCARAGERITREEVCEIFWGEGREPQGRHSLRQMLYRLRQKGFTLDEDGEELFLDPSRLDSDLTAALADGWPATATAAEVDAAGQLAPGFTRLISERFQEWFDGVRDRLAAQHRRACLTQIAQARREGRWADLDRWALQVLRSDPLNEEATLARAESAAISGSKAVALEIIDAYMEELGDRARVIGLPASILRRRIAERRSDWSSRGPREVPLIGRTELMARLTGYVDAASRGGSCSVLLLGAPGIGKTRLADETCAYAEMEGFQVVRMRSSTTSDARPMAVLSALIPSIRNLPGALGCAPATLAMLDQVVTHGPKSMTSGAVPFDSSISVALEAAVRDLLDAVLAECRLLVFTDDVHNADEISLSTLFAAMPAAASRFLWLATSRGRSVTERTLLSNRFSTSLLVSPLSDEESLLLASSAAPRKTQRRTEHIVKASGGNPLFLLELSVQDDRADDARELPRSLRELISDRLSRLPTGHLRLLQLTSLLEGQATVGRLRQLTASGSELADQLEDLEAQGIIRFNGARVVEVHECWHDAIEGHSGSAVIAALSLECASLLAQESPRVFGVAWRAALLLANVGEHNRSARLFADCGEDLLARGLPQEALAVTKRALPVAHSANEQIKLLLVQARAENASGLNMAALESCNRGLLLSGESPRAFANERITFLALRIELLQKTHGDTQPETLELASALDQDGLAPETVQFACLQGMACAFNSTPEPVAQRFLLQSQRSMKSHGHSMIGTLAELIFAAECGNVDDVAFIEERCRLLERATMPLALRTRSLYVRAMAQRFIGQFDCYELLANQCADLATKHRLKTDSSRIIYMRIFSALDQENSQEAERWLHQQEELKRSVSWPELDRAENHARARLDILRGEYDRARARYAPFLEMIQSDRLARRRCADQATLAYCNAACGNRSLSLAYLAPTLDLIRTSRPGFQLDYITDSSLKALTVLGHLDQTATLGADYASRRLRAFPAPLPPSLRELGRFIQRAQKAEAATSARLS